MSLLIRLLLLVYWIWSGGVNAYQGGAPVDTCSSMTPTHGSSGQALGGGNGGYSVTFSTAKYTLGETHQVNISSNGTQFRGFHCQIRNSADQRVGTFVNLPSNAKAVGCTPANSAATHNTRDLKTSIVLPWTAPATGTGTVNVFCTVVQKRDTFWVKIPSADIEESNTTFTTTAAATTLATTATTPAASTASILVMSTGATTETATTKNINFTTTAAAARCSLWMEIFLLVAVVHIVLK